VRQTGSRRFLVVAEDAGVATPRLLQEIASQGGSVVSSSEYRPSFDEVFAELVGREDGRQPRAEEQRDRSVARAA
jgi:hypothetical protein